MKAKDNLLNFLDKNHFITLPEAKNLGVSPMTVSRMVEDNTLFRTERSIYTTNLDWLADPLKKYLPACTLYPQAIISGISALTYYNLTDEEERKIWIAVPANQIVKNSHYQTLRLQGKCYSQGIKTIKFGERLLRIYDIEKTVIDAFKYQSEEVAYKALKTYLGRKDKNIKKLCDYGEILRKPIEDKVRFFMADE